MNSLILSLLMKSKLSSASSDKKVKVDFEDTGYAG